MKQQVAQKQTVLAMAKKRKNKGKIKRLQFAMTRGAKRKKNTDFTLNPFQVVEVNIFAVADAL